MYLDRILERRTVLARQNELEAQDGTEVAGAEATDQTQADMLD